MEEDKLVKILFNTGQAIHLYADESAIVEIISHPKFIKMRDLSNDVFVSLDDIVGFEVIEKQTEQLGGNGEKQPESSQ